MTNLELVNAVTFSPDGTVVAAGLADRTVHIWDVRTGQPYGPVLRGHTNEVESVDFSPDGVTGQCGRWSHCSTLGYRHGQAARTTDPGT